MRLHNPVAGGFTIEVSSNSGISAVHSRMDLSFPLCPHCLSLQMSLPKFPIINGFVSFQQNEILK